MVTGAFHHELTIFNAVNAALEICPSRCFFKGATRDRRDRFRGLPSAVSRQFGKHRLHQHVHGQHRGNRVARQTAKPCILQCTKCKRFTRLDCQFPKTDFAQLFQNIFGVIGFTHADATGSDHHICQALRLFKRGFQSGRAIWHDAEINRFAAEVFN
ncbi:Uncharacterised protein [Vibrio cholerae]|nr:Uncharacterised protein [Vibrio cholerae]